MRELKSNCIKCSKTLCRNVNGKKLLTHEQRWNNYKVRKWLCANCDAYDKNKKR